MIIASPTDFREAARRRVPRFLFDYAEGGANSEVTLRRNVSDLAEVSLAQRVLSGVGEVDLSTTLFGAEQALPVILGPVGIAGMYRRRGEVQAARAAHSAGIPFTLSTVSLCSLGEVARGASAEQLWFQLYVIRDRAFMRDVLRHRKGARCAHPRIYRRHARTGRAIPRSALGNVRTTGALAPVPAGSHAPALGVGCGTHGPPSSPR
jgi:L-lactate dehydrogenase (cytochrome)